MIFAESDLLYALLLLPLLPLFFAHAERRRLRLLEALVASPKPGLVMGSSFERRLIAMILVTLGLFLLVLAAARPQWGSRLENVTHRGLDILLAVDVSESMLARDVSPDRTSKARQEVEKFLRLAAGDRVGLIAFAGSAFTLCPLTVDYAAVRLFLSGLQPGMISDAGTDLSTPLAEAIDAFRRNPSPADKVVVLFTDGEHHEKDPMPYVHSAVKEGIQIFTVGIGNPAMAGERIPLEERQGVAVYKLDQAGNLVISQLDEKTLLEIATAAGGAYFRASEAGEELVQIYKALQDKEKIEFSSRQVRKMEDRFQIPLALSLLLLSTAFALGNRSFRKLRRTQELRS